MRAGNYGALGHALFADHSQNQRLSAVVAVNFHAGLKLHADLVLDKALRLGQRNCVVDRLALRAGLVQIVHVAAAVVFQGKAFLGVDQVIAVFLLVEKLAFEFIHAVVPP